MTSTPEVDPFEAFARSLEGISEAKKTAADAPAPEPVSASSTDEEVVDFFVETYLSTKKDIALAKATRGAAKDLLLSTVLGSIAKGLHLDPGVTRSFVAPGKRHAVEFSMTGKGIFDKSLLRTIDVPDGRAPPPGLSVSYNANKEAASEELKKALDAAMTGSKVTVAVKPLADAVSMPVIASGGVSGSSA